MPGETETSGKMSDVFETRHLTGNLRERSVRGGVFTILAQVAKFILQLGSTIVLARLLAPSDFGLLAMALVFTSFVAVFTDAGLSTATVQHQQINHAQISTLFWINAALGIGLMLLVMALAPFVAWFYDDSRLIPVTLGVATAFLFGGLSVQHLALLKRQMRFGAIGATDVASQVLGIAAAILLATQFDAGIWALLGLHIVPPVARMVFVWLLSGWRPGLPSRDADIGSMLRFGGRASAASFLFQAGLQADKLLVGWSLGPTVLGLYDRAFRLMRLPINQMNVPLTAVAIPALSRTLGDDSRYRRGFLATLQKMMLVAAPLITFAFIFADELIRLALGPQWREAGRIFQFLALGALVLPIRNATGWLFITQGRMKEHLRFHMLDSLTSVLSVLIGLAWGILGVSLAVSLRQFAVLPFLFWLAGRQGPVSTATLFGALAFPTAMVSFLVMALSLLRYALAGAVTMPVLLLCGMLLTILVTLTLAYLHPAGREILTGVIADAKVLRKKPLSVARPLDRRP
jgi:O-antigen/teichoic acid export membrane protein